MVLLHETVMSIYLNKLAHKQVVINCPYFLARMCTREDTRYRDKISVYLQRHPRAGEDTHLTSTQELVKIHNMCEDISI